MATVPVILPKTVGYDSDEGGRKASEKPNSGCLLDGGWS